MFLSANSADLGAKNPFPTQYNAYIYIHVYTHNISISKKHEHLELLPPNFQHLPISSWVTLILTSSAACAALRIRWYCRASCHCCALPHELSRAFQLTPSASWPSSSDLREQRKRSSWDVERWGCGRRMAGTWMLYLVGFCHMLPLSMYWVTCWILSDPWGEMSNYNKETGQSVSHHKRQPCDWKKLAANCQCPMLSLDLHWLLRRGHSPTLQLGTASPHVCVCICIYIFMYKCMYIYI